LNIIDTIFQKLNSDHTQQTASPTTILKAERASKKAVKALEKAGRALAEVEREVEVVDRFNEPSPAPALSNKPVYKTYEDFPPEDLYLYAGLDCIATSELLSRLYPHTVREPKLLAPGKNGEMVETRAPAIIKSNHEILMPSLEFIIDLELNGLQYDCDENRRTSARMVREIAEFDDRIFSAIGKRINLDSGTEVGAYLYGERGFTAPFQTKSGDDSTDGQALLTLAGLDHRANLYVTPDPAFQFLADMAKRRDINSVHNTFVRTYIEDWVKRDGRIHPSYNLHGTSSFRITGDNPNLTQLPRPKHGYNVRHCFTVRDGHLFIAFDFSSAEVKILGALCKDPNILRAIAEGLDFHSFSASSMLGVPYAEFVAALKAGGELGAKYKHYRQIAKILTFSILYGSSEGGIAMQLGVSKAEAQGYIKMYFDAYPGMAGFIEDSHRMAIWNQYVVTPFGQRKQQFGTYPVFKPTAAYNAALRNSANVRVQSTTSTLGLVVFSHLNEAIKKLGGMSICTVYDSIEMEIPIERAAEAIETAFYYMDEWPVQHFDFLDLPIGVEGEIGTSWGNLQTIHRGVNQNDIGRLLSTMH
jgi:DNA polymerase-1